MRNQLIEFVTFVYDTVLVHADARVTKNFGEAKGHQMKQTKQELIEQN